MEAARRSLRPVGTGRTITLNEGVLDALVDDARRYVQRLGETKLGWFLFPGGGGKLPTDPTVPITTLGTAWTSVREKAV